MIKKAFRSALAASLYCGLAAPCRAQSAPPGVRVFSEPRGAVWSISFSSDASLLAAASDVTSGAAGASSSSLGSQIRVWETQTGLMLLALAFEGRVKAVALSPDGQTLAAGTTEGILLYDARSGERKQTFFGDLKSIDALAFSRDGWLLVSQSSEEGKGELRVRTAAGQHVASFSSDKTPFGVFSLSADGKILAAEAADEIRLWDTASGLLKRTIREQDEVKSAALSAGGELLAAPVVFELKLWDARTGKLARAIPEFFTDVAFSGDGRRLAGLLNETVSVLDARTWAFKKVVEMGGIASSFAISFDGAWLATGHGGAGEGSVRLWRLDLLKDQPVKRKQNAAGPRLPQVRAFSCDATQVTKDTPLKPVVDGGGDQLLLRPTAEPCRYDLVYQDAGGRQSVVSKSPGMYLVAAARKFATLKGATSLVCASNISHSRFAANPGKSPRSLTRHIDAAPLDCAAAVDGQWGPAATVLSGGFSWAAWVTGLEAASAPGVYAARFIHDSTFQFLSASDQPRAAGDGVYELQLIVERGKAPRAGGVVKRSDKVPAVDIKAP